MSIHPTPYPDVNSVLDLLRSDVQTILKDRFIGMVLYGSLSSGDFDPQRSDIDFVVITSDELPDEIISALEAMHTRIAASGLKWAAKLEGSYVPQETLRRHDPAAPPCPTINEGQFYVERLGSDWTIQRHIIREHGVVVAGPAPQTVIDPVQPDDLRRAVLGVLREWWSLHLDDPSRLHARYYQAFAILTMCRALYALEFGSIVSKPVAARWAQGALGERWASLIERALVWQYDEPLDSMDNTLSLIRYTLERGQQLQLPVD